MKNYKLDETLLPEVWVTWMSKDGRIWMNNSGARFNRPMSWMRYDDESDMGYLGWRKKDSRIPFGNNYESAKSDKMWVQAGSQLYYAYAKYHPDIDRLELAVVKYDTNRGDGEHHWMYAGDRLFIGKDKTVINENGLYCNRFAIKNSTAWGERQALQCILHATPSTNFINEFKKFIGRDYFIIGNGASEYIQYPWHLQKWYDSVQKTRTAGKSQKLVDELTALPLGDINHLAYKYLPVELPDKWGNSTVRNNILYFERVNDEWSVLRALIRNDDGEFEESWRVYLGDDGTNRIASKSDDGWIPASQNRGWHFRRQYYFANKDEALEKCNRIKYIAPIIESEEIDALITTLRFPAIEQLYKMGQTKLAKSIATDGTPKAYIKNVFGYYNEKEKNVLRQIGMTKQQLDLYCNKRDNRYFHSSSVMEIIRAALGNDLSRVSYEIFSKYMDAINDMLEGSYEIINRVNNLNIDKSRFWKNTVRLNEKNNSSARLIADTLQTHARLYGEPVEVDWIFDDYSDIVRTHDALNALVSERKAERMAYYNMEEKKRRELDDKKRKETDEKRKHYEYEDDEFIIRLPKDVYEIINEGTRQSICIGGYTTRHSKGETNLFFLRRKDAESVPFYAIEMNNAKQIVQIHGHSNKWLGNNPEAIPTVVRWLRKNDIKCDDKILTCTARGYGRTNEYIEMPQVD